jgi:hypothetical protein
VTVNGDDVGLEPLAVVASATGDDVSTAANL